jgi:hypothetical protein
MSARDQLWRARQRLKEATHNASSRLEWWGLNRGSGTTTHYFDFTSVGVTVGDTVDREGWETLRASGSVFGIPHEREAWEASADSPSLIARAEDIVRIAHRLGARKLVSYGVGGATLELNITRVDPSLELTCTEYAGANVRQLQRLFPEARTIAHDLVAADPLDADLHLFHRVDTELSNKQWHEVLARIEGPVLFVPGSILTWDRFVIERRMRTNRAASRAGFVRTAAGVRALWHKSHRAEEIPIGELCGFLLSRR